MASVTLIGNHHCSRINPTVPLQQRLGWHFTHPIFTCITIGTVNVALNTKIQTHTCTHAYTLMTREGSMHAFSSSRLHNPPSVWFCGYRILACLSESTEVVRLETSPHRIHSQIYLNNEMHFS